MLHAFLLTIALGADPKPNDVPIEIVERLASRCNMTTDEFRAFAQSCERCRPQAIRVLKKLIASEKSLRGRLQKDSSERAESENRLSKFEARLETIKDRTDVAYPYLSVADDLFVGALPNNRIKVLQVIDGSSFRGELDGGREVIVRKFPTSGMADDTLHQGGDCFRFSGSESYITVLGGKRTLSVLEPFDTRPVTEYCRLAFGKKSVQKQAANP